MKGFPILFKQKEDCCGCTACYSVCPSNAIIMQTDSEGFEYPVVNKEKCVKCQKCISACPIKRAYKEKGIKMVEKT